MNHTTRLIQLLDEMFAGSRTPVEVHDVFWSEIWGDEWEDSKGSDDIALLISNQIFEAFECFDGEYADVEPNDVPHEITQEEFLQRCREFLPKLKELASKD